MWTITATGQTSAPIERVWQAYLDFANWNQWDKGLDKYQPDGPFTTGASGVLQPPGGPELPFSLLLVEDGRRFDDRTPIDEQAAIIGRHVLTPLANGTQITHTVEIEAPNAEEMAQMMGFKQEDLQETVTNLARYVEAQ